ncbi:MAG: hypothetical protein GXY46_06975, partial [Actinobacteria bacterium]|nr:hypothetical protein [Actinomycetota bacterium]
LVVLERLPEGEQPRISPERLRETIQAAFGQRRKTLANSLAAGLGLSRETAQAMVEALGLPANVRAERLEPGRFTQLAARWAREKKDEAPWREDRQSGSPTP